MIGGAYYVHMSMSAPLKIKKKRYWALCCKWCTIIKTKYVFLVPKNDFPRQSFYHCMMSQ